MLGGSLLMTPANEAAFADYFVKYLEAYQAAGVLIDYISLQNEPLYIPTSLSRHGDERSGSIDPAARLLPAGIDRQSSLHASSSFTTTIGTRPSYPEAVLSDPTVLASTQVAGTAWHGYGGTARRAADRAEPLPRKREPG
jgi:glucosylceramidase